MKSLEKIVRAVFAQFENTRYRAKSSKTEGDKWGSWRHQWPRMTPKWLFLKSRHLFLWFEYKLGYPQNEPNFDPPGRGWPFNPYDVIKESISSKISNSNPKYHFTTKKNWKKSKSKSEKKWFFSDFGPPKWGQKGSIWGQKYQIVGR